MRPLFLLDITWSGDQSPYCAPLPIADALAKESNAPLDEVAPSFPYTSIHSNINLRSGLRIDVGSRGG
jgi:hypothetical protein